MRRFPVSSRIAALTAVALLLGATSCNDLNDPDGSEAVPLVTQISVSGTSVAATTTDVVATLTVKVNNRSGSTTSFFNDVTFDSFSVVYTPTGVVPDVTIGVISTGFVPAGGTGTLALTMVAGSSKSGVSAGTVVNGAVHVEGQDALGNPVSFDVSVAIQFTS
ncbi:MAG: hypothetical protein ACE5JH_09325 [Acidobacteriota bacterium]